MLFGGNSGKYWGKFPHVSAKGMKEVKKTKGFPDASILSKIVSAHKTMRGYVCGNGYSFLVDSGCMFLVFSFREYL